MQTNKNVKGRAVFSDSEDIKERSLKLYMYFVCIAYLRNKPDRFGDNVRIFQHKDIVLTKIKKVLRIKDDRTIKKYLDSLEERGLIKFCPNGWAEKIDKKWKDDNDIEHTERIPLVERWKERNKHKNDYYEIPIKEGMLFRKIPKETIQKLNEEYCVDELTLKVYMTLVNYQESCILNGYTYKAFTYKDLRDILGYRLTTEIDKKFEGILNQLKGLGLIEIEKGSRINKYGVEIPVFVLTQANFYVNFEMMDFEPANENAIEEKQIEEVKEENKEAYNI